MKITEKAYALTEAFMGALSGDKRDTARFFETLTTSDSLPLLEPALNRKLVDDYMAEEVAWEKFAARETFDDFRIQEIVSMGFTNGTIPAFNNGQAYTPDTLPRLGELGEYPTIKPTATGVQFRIGKSGVKYEVSWERIINDRSLREIERVWKEFALLARNTEVEQATLQFVNSTGLSANLTSDNKLSGNPELSFASLESAWLQAATHTVGTSNARVRLGEKMNLFVPPALVPTAKRILSITEISVEDSNTSTTVKSGNPLAGKFDIVENHWIPTIDATNGDTTWGIMPKPNVVPNGGAAVGFLRGHEQPKIFVRSTHNGSELEGDFDNDAYQTKVRHTATGFWRGEGAGIVFSNGTKS